MARLFYLVVALGVVGCGNVAVSSDAKVDAPDPDALVCVAPQLACDHLCVDSLTSNTNCGECGTTCTAKREACQAGHCVDQYTSCAAIHAFDPSAIDGFYTFVKATVLYCDL